MLGAVAGGRGGRLAISCKADGQVPWGPGCPGDRGAGSSGKAPGPSSSLALASAQAFPDAGRRPRWEVSRGRSTFSDVL